MSPVVCVPAQVGTSRDTKGGPRQRGDAQKWQ